jgi:hypothetical protein
VAFSSRPRCEDEFDAVAAQEGSNFMGGAQTAPAVEKQPWEA